MTHIKWDAQDKAFEVITEHLSRPEQIIEDIAANMAEEALNLVREGFESAEDPYGKAWAEKQIPNGSRPLHGPTGELRNNWHLSLAKDGFTIANGKIYASVHQGGATIRPKSKKYLRFMAGDKAVFAKKVTIPPRPMVPKEGDMPPKWEQRFKETAKEILEIALADT